MQDNELRGLVLRKFYDLRRRGRFQWAEFAEQANEDPFFDMVGEDLFRICDQLAQHGLIDWVPVPSGSGKSIGGLGQISAAGIDLVEGYSQAPVPISFDTSNRKMSQPTNNMLPANQRIFIGHGRSLLWRELKDFIHDRLSLQWDEFNRESTAGIHTVDRLQEMMNGSCFAFIVMTAEDEHRDGTRHGRANVIHEAGLFQGKLGFRRAIILLEEGCEEFSNIAGLTQIRFPLGDILARSEQIRGALEREGVLKK